MSLDAPLTHGLVTPQHVTGNGLDRFPDMCGSRSGIRWHCAWTKQGREQQAATSIAAAGFQAYLPMHLNVRAYSRSEIVPLFARYVFCRFDPDIDAWGCISNLRGVCGLIRHGCDKPTTLPDAAILELQARTSVRGVVDDPGETPWEGVGAGYRPIWQDMAGLDAGSRQRLLIRLFGASASRIVTEDAA